MTQDPKGPPKDFVVAPDPRVRRHGVAWEEVWRKARVLLLVVVCVALAVVSMLLYTSERRTIRGGEQLATPEQLEALRQRSLRLEAEFEALRQRKFELAEADIALLEQALQAYEEYIIARRSIGTDNDRQQGLRRRLHLLRAEKLRQESVENETRALAMVKTDEPGAVVLLRRAVACEQEIEARWGYSGLADPGRRARLDTRLRRHESAPLWQAGRAAEAEAERSLADRRYPQAAAAFERAIALETEFLAKYRDVRDTEFGRTDKLAARLATALSGDAWAAVRARADQAAQAEQAGDWPAAARAWQAAVDEFGRLLIDHPRSEFADRAGEAAYVVRLNFARFHDDVVRARAVCDRARAALRARESESAQRLIEDALGQARRLADAGTGVFGPADPERAELEYLAAHPAVIRGLLPSVDARFAPVPGRNIRLFRTEVPQGLYASVMGANPSATRREANPVDSVTHADAELFARRLGWLLGAPARLPSVDEYQAAAGVPPGSGQAWTSENTDGVSARPAGTTTITAAGFHDLFGNVEEWAAAAAAETRAPVVGGSVADPAPREFPVRAAYKRDQSRTRGFRIVIE